jgi:hypothetical protein
MMFLPQQHESAHDSRKMSKIVAQKGIKRGGKKERKGENEADLGYPTLVGSQGCINKVSLRTGPACHNSFLLVSKSTRK